MRDLSRAAASPGMGGIAVREGRQGGRAAGGVWFR